jgi:hypothetical protein
MAKGDSRTRQLQRNPLTVIAALIGVVEAAFAYPVTKLTGTNQTVFVLFMVCFPVLLLLCFFITVWFRPAHLYGPSDYTQDNSFLAGIGRIPAFPGAAVTPPPYEPPPGSKRESPAVVTASTAIEVEKLEFGERS